MAKELNWVVFNQYLPPEVSRYGLEDEIGQDWGEGQP